MLGYSSSFGTSANDHFGPRPEHSPTTTPDWGPHSCIGGRSNLLFDVDTYPPSMRSSVTGYGNVPTSFPSDVINAANEQIGARWSAHYQPDSNSLNSTFFPNPQHSRADLSGNGITGSGFAGQIGGSRPDRLVGTVGIAGAERNFSLPRGREALANVDWSNI